MNFIDDIGTVLGWPLAYAIIQAYGGEVLYIPSQPNAALCRRLGERHAKALCAYAANCKVYIPQRSGRDIAQRNQLISELTAKGLSSADIGNRLNISARRVQQLIAHEARSKAKPRATNKVQNDAIQPEANAPKHVRKSRRKPAQRKAPVRAGAVQ